MNFCSSKIYVTIRAFSVFFADVMDSGIWRQVGVVLLMNKILYQLIFVSDK